MNIESINLTNVNLKVHLKKCKTNKIKESLFANTKYISFGNHKKFAGGFYPIPQDIERILSADQLLYRYT